MTTNDIDAIRKLTNAATRGPWTNGRDGLAEYEVHLSAFLPVLELSAGLQGEANAAFIAAARTHVPALCDEVEQLRAELAAMRPVTDAAKAWVKFEGLTEQNDLAAAVERLNCAGCRAEQAEADR